MGSLVAAFALGCGGSGQTGTPTSSANSAGGGGEAPDVRSELEQLCLSAPIFFDKDGNKFTVDSVPQARPEQWSPECVPKLPNWVRAQPESNAASFTGPIDVTFQDGLLTTVAGRRCMFCDPRTITFPAVYDYQGCEHRWVCEPGENDLYENDRHDPFWQVSILDFAGDDFAPRWTITNDVRWFLGNADVAFPDCPAKCTGKACGSDFCGGSCGDCDAGLTCSSDGADMQLIELCVCPLAQRQRPPSPARGEGPEVRLTEAARA